MSAVKIAALAESRFPGRSRAARMSCSCTHASMIRRCRCWPNVVSGPKSPPMTVSTSASEARSSATRSGVELRELGDDRRVR